MSKRLLKDIIISLIKILIFSFIIFIYYFMYTQSKKHDEQIRQHYITDSIAQPNIDTVIIHGIKYIKIK